MSLMLSGFLFYNALNFRATDVEHQSRNVRAVAQCLIRSKSMHDALLVWEDIVANSQFLKGWDLFELVINEFRIFENGFSN